VGVSFCAPRALLGGIFRLRKTLCVIPVLLLLVAVSAPYARADTFENFTISFTGSNAPTVVGSDLVTVDTSTMFFTTPSIEVQYDSTDITLVLDQTVPVTSMTDDFQWWVLVPAYTPGLHFFDNTTGGDLYYGNTPACAGGSNCAFGHIIVPFASGEVTFTPTATPEPSTGVLVPLAVGIVFMMRRRRVERRALST